MDVIGMKTASVILQRAKEKIFENDIENMID